MIAGNRFKCAAVVLFLWSDVIWKKSTSNFERIPFHRVPQEDIDRVIEVARWAPSGFNLQPWEFVVVRKPEPRKPRDSVT